METNIIIEGDCLLKLKEFPDESIDAIVTDPPYGLSFMGKKWDYDVPSIDIWKECFRVLKPGGYLLGFSGTRTYHRMVVKIEDAGFEIRDMIAWVYGSGFPKSLNIGKAVDKLQGNEREVTGYEEKAKPTFHSQNVGGEIKEIDNIQLTKGTSEWEGWGTALKPALEPIVVARKPLSEKTVAENVLKWGTGGINIDGCRIGTSEKINSVKNHFSQRTVTITNNQTPDWEQNSLGRFPSNFIHDGSEEVLSLFPDNKGAIAKVKSGQKGFGGVIYGKYKTGGDDGASFYEEGKLGSASRFFYCAKASPSERNKGCEELEEQKVGDGRKKEVDNAFQRGKTLRHNTHPTVKPIALMEYLVKLVSRENAIVLDPFAGSGSTLIACKKVGRQYIGIEREPEYVKIARARLNSY